jgi:hypothetical protein
MRELEGLLKSFVNIDRASLIAILSAEADAATQLANTARRRTSPQRAKRNAAMEGAARLQRMLSFFRDGEIPAKMSEADLTLCKLLEERLRRPI